MSPTLPLRGVRFHLAGSVSDEAGEEDARGIRDFVRRFTAAVLREGGTLIHGSHPSLEESLRLAAEPFVAADGPRDALTLVRSHQFAVTDEHLATIARQRKYAAVHVTPAKPGDATESLVPMREWMAERSDVVVAVGGKWYDVHKARAGVPDELEESLRRGKAGFIVAGFGGAIQGYSAEHGEVFSRLRNGLSEAVNRSLAQRRDVGELVDAVLSQVRLLPVLRGGVLSGRFRILSLDGGGLRGVFTAAVLAKWDAMLEQGGGEDFGRHFDLIAGTSTGAILAIGLGLGLPPGRMLDFYRKEGPKIFPKDRKLRHWLRSKHDSRTLRATLEAVYGGRSLSKDSRCRLVIPTVRAKHGEAEVIVTAHSPDRRAFHDISAVDAALASSAAPTYFDEAFVDDGIASQAFIDGGVWANNPVLPAVSEAVRYLRIPLERIDVLSVGTMGSEADFGAALGKGKAGWAASSADLFFAAQEQGAAMLADALLSRARHLRVNQQTPTEIKLDDSQAIEDMAQRGANVGADTFETVRSRFIDGIHVPDWREPLP